MTDREAFEAWYEERSTDLCTSGHEWNLRDANGHYKDGSVWDHWYIWQASIKHEREEWRCSPSRSPRSRPSNGD